MTFTLDYATTLGQVRAIVGDITEATAAFPDEQLNAYLGLESDRPLLAAALAFENLATRPSVGRRVAGDISMDNAQVSRACLEAGQRCRDRDSAVAAGAGDGFDIAEFVLSPAGVAERLWDEALRGGG